MLINQVKTEITKKLKRCRHDLKALDTSRQTSAQQSQYLTEVVMQFQKLSGEALLSNYGFTDAFDQYPTLRLATAVVNRSKQMSDTFAMKGYTFQFEAGDEAESGALNDVGSLVVDISDLDIEDGNAGTPTQLEEVAGEDLTVKRKRMQLERELKNLEDGKRILS